MSDRLKHTETICGSLCMGVCISGGRRVCFLEAALDPNKLKRPNTCHCCAPAATPLHRHAMLHQARSAEKAFDGRSIR